MSKKLKSITVYFYKCHYELRDKVSEKVSGKTHGEAWKNFCKSFAIAVKGIPALGDAEDFEFADGPYTCVVRTVVCHR